MPEELYYKYLAPERVDVLQNCKIRFTQLSALNDPFECKFIVDPIKKEEEKAIDDDYLAEWAHVEVFLGNINQMWGMLCTTRNPHNLLMWSHYARNHQGIVIGFSPNSKFWRDKVFFQQYPLPPDEICNIGFGEMRPVLYSTERPRIQLNETLPASVFFTKNPVWRYEEEYRVFQNLVFDDTNESNSRICLKKFESDDIQEIIIGANASHFTVETLRAMKQSQKFRNARWQQAQLSRRDYKLNFCSF